jgi:16S rRNA (cytosine967-C5)-methyltransferase
VARRAAIHWLTGRSYGGRLSSRDRAFALRLQRETTVWRARLDRALAPYCSRKLEELDSQVLAALRIGAVQLLVLSTPAHAAVGETVEAMRGNRAGGMVNAVLRKLARSGEPDPDSMSLAQRWSHPDSLVDRWIRRFGLDDTERLLRWNNQVPPLGGTAPGDFPDLDPGRYLENYRYIPRSGSETLEHLSEGFYIQDEAAALVGASCASLASGKTVLELCAAPGGKTHHLQASADRVFSMDIDPVRLGSWLSNRRRLKWDTAFCLAADGVHPPFNRSFDLVVLDAPCTNTGVYRRRPDARWNWSEEFLSRITDLQRELLHSAWNLVNAGGHLVYSTCSLEEEENFQQVRRFEDEADSARRTPLDAPAELVTDGMISIFPPEHLIDGHFAAAWRRI